MTDSSNRSIPRDILEPLMFGTGSVRRFTQDSPVLPDVWIRYSEVDAKGEFPAVRVLLTPWRDVPPGLVAADLRQRMKGKLKQPPRLIYNQTTVAVTLAFEDLVRFVVPMTEWWRRVTNTWAVADLKARAGEVAEALIDPEHAPQMERLERRGELLPADILWVVRVVGALKLARRGPLPHPFDDARKIPTAKPDDWRQLVDAAYETVAEAEPYAGEAMIYAVSLNRDASATIARSTLSIKADAARRLFDISCEKLRWAIIDTGIDARHLAFRKRDGRDGPLLAEAFAGRDGNPVNNTRVMATYDFTGLGDLLDPDTDELPLQVRKRLGDADAPDLRAKISDLNRALSLGRAIDWSLIEPLIRIEHVNDRYEPPPHDHGTHVAGILAADWRKTDHKPLKDDLVGVCPDLQLFDLRVLDGHGHGDEFSVMAALQFVRYLNARSDYMAVHGANLSLSIPHDIANYACGRTPVCEECERVVSSGVIVVAAAGNQGYRKYTTSEGVTTEAYNSISITDPGNADLVITVGATHRFRPHTYGVSFFSSRGPTGDGRVKPDLVAPGEKILAPLPNSAYGLKDGTSMAAPHVSGAAALLIARHNELIGRPQRVKQVLCSTATDLGRERYFQGAGMLDVLRALQAV